MTDSKQIWADQLRELVERAQREGLSGEVCSACSVFKPVSEFHKNKSRPNGYQAECKLCQNARSQTRNHGMNVDEYNGLLARQKWVCAICGVSSKIKRLHIDHDHFKRCNCENKSCFVCRRGLLCVNCNTALGMFRDDTTIMTNAIAYIERWRNTPK